MRFPITAFALAASLPFAAQADDPVVVELFTSQGCSSCPAADAMLGKLAERDDVIALSLHVDYWDWIGWEDTFAHAAFSERQRAYAAGWGSSMVYTPQFIIGGRLQVAGAEGMEVAEAIDAAREAAADLIRALPGGDGVAIGAAEGGGRIVLVSLLPKASVSILHGENAGHTITYHNVVAGWDVLADWSGEAARIEVPAAGEGLRRVVLAQRVEGGRPGPILGAVRLD